MANRPSGIVAFSIVWAGQFISMLGTGLTSFATIYWAFDLTNSATPMSILSLCTFAPSVVIGPIAGAYVDRWNRKFTMLLSDLAAGVSTITLFTLYTTGNLELWHLYVTGLFTGIFSTFQWPAYMAAMSAMIPKEHYTRANGMISFGNSAMAIVAPILAGVLLPWIGISGILAIDIVTFIIAIIFLIAVAIPNPTPSADSMKHKGSIWREAAYGFRFVLERPGLLGLQLVFLAMNLVNNFGLPLRQPMVLARTGSDAAVLASVNSAAAFGSLAGSLLMTVWAGFRRKVNGVLIGMILQGLLGSVLFGLGQGPITWIIAAFSLSFFIAVLQTSATAIWQAKVPLDLQGRVMSTRRLIAHGAIPLGMALAGPLADNLFEPAMAPGGALSGLFGEAVGIGTGSGMALMLVFAGVLSALAGLSGFFFRSVRYVDTELPDHDAKRQSAAQG